MKTIFATPALKAFLLCLCLSSLLCLSIRTLRFGTVLISTPSSPTGLRIRPGSATYEVYIQRQLRKTLNPRLRQVWTTTDWGRKVDIFAAFFREHRRVGLLSNTSRALSVGARVGQEVAALRKIGVPDSIGVDLVPHPPLVVEGDFHRLPFKNDSFDFEFSNVFDHALYPDRFVGEIERTLRPGGVAVLHVAIMRKGDKYSANDLYDVGSLVALFQSSDVVHVKRVDGLGLDTEVAFRKRNVSSSSSSSSSSSLSCEKGGCSRENSSDDS